MAGDDSAVVVPPRDISITPDRCRHSMKLNGDDVAPLVPRGHDITSFVLEDLPEHLVKVHVHIGGMHAVTFHREDFVEKQNMFPKGFPLSMCLYNYVELILEYDQGFVSANSKIEMVDEMAEEILYSDSEDEFYDHDTGCYSFGHRVHRVPVYTGRKIANVVEGARARTPRLLISVEKSTHDDKEAVVCLPVWERMLIDPVDDEALAEVQRLVNTRKLHVANRSVDDMVRAGQPFEAKLENMIRFKGGLAGKAWAC